MPEQVDGMLEQVIGSCWSMWQLEGWLANVLGAVGNGWLK